MVAEWSDPSNLERKSKDEANEYYKSLQNVKLSCQICLFAIVVSTKSHRVWGTPSEKKENVSIQNLYRNV